MATEKQMEPKHHCPRLLHQIPGIWATPRLHPTAPGVFPSVGDPSAPTTAAGQALTGLTDTTLLACIKFGDVWLVDQSSSQPPVAGQFCFPR